MRHIRRPTTKLFLAMLAVGSAIDRMLNVLISPGGPLGIGGLGKGYALFGMSFAHVSAKRMKAAELLAANIAGTLDPDNLSDFSQTAFIGSNVVAVGSKISKELVPSLLNNGTLQVGKDEFRLPDSA